MFDTDTFWRSLADSIRVMYGGIFAAILFRWLVVEGRAASANDVTAQFAIQAVLVIIGLTVVLGIFYHYIEILAPPRRVATIRKEGCDDD